MLTMALLVGVPLLLLIRRGRRAGLIGAVLSVSFLALFLLGVHAQGWWLHSDAEAGDWAAQYRYAQWLENHPGQINELIPWPVEKPDVYGGFTWLEKAAGNGYPPAVWLLGVRLKQDTFIPPPVVIQQKKSILTQSLRGQRMMEIAVNRLGYKPKGDEKTFYWERYRRGYAP
jgi:hypothetical protein